MKGKERESRKKGRKMEYNSGRERDPKGKGRRKNWGGILGTLLDSP